MDGMTIKVELRCPRCNHVETYQVFWAKLFQRAITFVCQNYYCDVFYPTVGRNSRYCVVVDSERDVGTLAAERACGTHEGGGW